MVLIGFTVVIPLTFALLLLLKACRREAVDIFLFQKPCTAFIQMLERSPQLFCIPMGITIEAIPQYLVHVGAAFGWFVYGRRTTVCPFKIRIGHAMPTQLIRRCGVVSAFVTGKCRLLICVTIPTVLFGIPQIHLLVDFLYIKCGLDVIIVILIVVSRLKGLGDISLHSCLRIYHVIFYSELVCARVYHHVSFPTLVLCEFESNKKVVVSTQFECDGVVVIPGCSLKFCFSRIMKGESVFARNLIVGSHLYSGNVGAHKFVTREGLEAKISSFVDEFEVELVLRRLYAVGHAAVAGSPEVAVVVGQFLILAIIDSHLVVFTILSGIVHHVFVAGFIDTRHHKLESSLLAFCYGIAASFELTAIILHVDAVILFPKEMSIVGVH
ncbi:hypothetical protein HMPREF0649_01117 [Segatella buccae D17]|nr:hypothetical protein HMPREF0649_01117 [Segatella buccae D17]